MKKFIAMICVIAMMLSILTGCGINRKDLYNPENNDIMLGRVFFEEVEVTEADYVDAGSQKEQVDMLYDSMKNVKSLDRENFSEIETQMIEFFKTQYDVDITNKLGNIETYLFDVKSNDYYLMGCHIPGDNKVYVNRDLYKETPEFFAFTWCHEVIHLLGIDYKNNAYWGLYEAVTEALNIELINWMGKECNPQSSYWSVADVGKQLISANPELVSKSLTDDDFYLEDSINEILKNANYTEAEPPENTTIAFQFNAYLICMIEQNMIYLQFGEILEFFVQEITIAYCRKFNLTEEQIEDAKANWLIPDFDQTTISCRGNYIELKR